MSEKRYDETYSKNFEQPPTPTIKIKAPWWKRYRWHMRHYFYIHVFIFVFNGLLGGLAVVIIENYIKPNRFMRVRYIDTWFIAASCVYNCGLTTLDFARLSTYSQVILMLFTLASGITVSTLPALIIKSRTHKRERGLRVDDDHSAYNIQTGLDKKLEYSPEAEIKIARLPNAEQLRYRAYLSCLALIPLTCITIYLGAYVCIGGWIHTRYRPSQLRQDGRPVNAWYASFIITVTGFNQNGLTPWSDSLMRFFDDAVLNIFVMLVRIFCLN
jgi:Trk-type K+ transport system membrane component